MASIQMLGHMYGCDGIQKLAPAKMCMTENLKYMDNGPRKMSFSNNSFAFYFSHPEIFS